MKFFENDDIIITEINDNIDVKIKSGKFDSSFSKFLKQYPELSASAIQVGSTAIAAYKSNKDNTARFFAKTTLERKLYADIVAVLNSSGKFKMVTKKFQDGGVFYELVHK